MPPRTDIPRVSPDVMLLQTPDIGMSQSDPGRICPEKCIYYENIGRILA